VVHGSLSPDSIVVAKDKHLRIRNYQDARFFGKREEHNIIFSAEERTFTDSELNFIAPEILEENLISPAADYWSLGCIIYFMLSGKKPFEEKKREDTAYSILMNNCDIIALPVSIEAKDLLIKLMQLVVEMRLGSGPSGS